MPGYIVLPLFKASLENQRPINIGFGFSIEMLPEFFFERLRGSPDILGGYRRRLDDLSVGLFLRPGEGHILESVFNEDVLDSVLFSAYCLRLVTGIPLDFPFWMAISEDGANSGYGTTQKRNFAASDPYTYPIDNDDHAHTLRLFSENISYLIEIQRENISITGPNNRIIHAIDTMAFAYQMQYLGPRIINAVTFLESLFSYESIEITHQLAAALSWYLAPNDAETRFQVYKSVRDIYRERSRVAHGEMIGDELQARVDKIKATEELCRKVFNRILENGHIPAFSNIGKDARKNNLRKLMLGVPCEYLTH